MRSDGVAVVEEINVGFVADSGPGVRFVSVNGKAIAVGEATFEEDVAGRGGAVARFERKAGLKGCDAQKLVVEFLSDKRVRFTDAVPVDAVPTQLSIGHQRERKLFGFEFAADAQRRSQTDGVRCCVKPLCRAEIADVPGAILNAVSEKRLTEEAHSASEFPYCRNARENALRASGSASDQSEADRQVRDNGEKAIAKAPVQKDASGNVVSAPEINLTWALINSGNFTKHNSQELKEVMMTLVGTTIIRKSGSGQDAVLTSTHYSGVDLLPILFGEVRGNVKIERLKCDEPKRCLKVTSTATSDGSLVDQLQAAAANYRKAVEQRNASLVSDRELMLLGGTTGVPLLRVLNLAATSRYRGIADDLVRIYVDAAAYELLAAAVNALAGDIKAALSGSSAKDHSAQHVEHVRLLEERIEAVQQGVYQRQDKLLQGMARASNLILQLEHIEKSLAVNQVAPTFEAWPESTKEFK